MGGCQLGNHPQPMGVARGLPQGLGEARRPPLDAFQGGRVPPLAHWLGLVKPPPTFLFLILFIYIFLIIIDICRHLISTDVAHNRSCQKF